MPTGLNPTRDDTLAGNQAAQPDSCAVDRDLVLAMGVTGEGDTLRDTGLDQGRSAVHRDPARIGMNGTDELAVGFDKESDRGSLCFYNVLPSTTNAGRRDGRFDCER